MSNSNFRRVPIPAHENIMTGRLNMPRYNHFPIKPIKRSFFDILYKLWQAEETVNRINIFTIYLNFIGLMGVTGSTCIIGYLEAPSMNFSWSFIGPFSNRKIPVAGEIKQTRHDYRVIKSIIQSMSSCAIDRMIMCMLSRGSDRAEL